jgi:hypothetical protein
MLQILATSKYLFAVDALLAIFSAPSEGWLLTIDVVMAFPFISHAQLEIIACRTHYIADRVGYFGNRRWGQ